MIITFKIKINQKKQKFLKGIHLTSQTLLPIGQKNQN